MCACVITIAFTVRPRRATISSTLAISSPGSTTSASPDRSSGDLVPGVHHERLARSLVAEDGAVALERSHGEDLMDHTPIVYSPYVRSVEHDHALAAHLLGGHAGRRASLCPPGDDAGERDLRAGSARGAKRKGRRGLPPTGLRSHNRPAGLRPV